MYTTVRRDVDPLTYEEWTFMLWENYDELRCSSYVKQQRPSIRHKKYLRVAWWDSLSEAPHLRTSTRLEREDVPWDDALASEALQKLIAQIRVLPPRKAP